MLAVQQLREILRDAAAELAQIAPDAVVFDRPLRELGVDSLMALELVVRMERRFGIRLNDEEIRSVRTMDDMLALAIQKGTALGWTTA